jgi:S-adenosylmethionine:tRNA ribosyltransferase-isomerase
VLESRRAGTWTVRFEGTEDVRALAERVGRVPLPPYIRREAGSDPRDAADRVRYQTVFAREPVAAAAPTAGLHFTGALREACAARGVGWAAVTLAVGPGTFRPVKCGRVEEHPMHPERWRIPEETAAAVRKAKAAGGRIVAVGTTAVRTLEAAAAASPDGLPAAGEGTTDLFILPGFRFRAADALLTNFHLPRSTLLGLVFAFAGRDRVLAAYGEAVRERYRFFSYGDAMLVI